MSNIEIEFQQIYDHFGKVLEPGDRVFYHNTENVHEDYEITEGEFAKYDTEMGYVRLTINNRYGTLAVHGANRIINTFDNNIERMVLLTAFKFRNQKHVGKLSVFTIRSRFSNAYHNWQFNFDELNKVVDKCAKLYPDYILNQE